MFYQCRNQSPKGVCEALANVYYTAVRNFGRSSVPAGLAKVSTADAPEMSEEDADAYNKAVEAYEQAVKEAEEEGLL